MPSKFESFCIGVEDALGVGTPCLAANTSALSEWIDGTNCLGFDYPVDVDALGIPYVDYGVRFGRRMGRIYNPLTVAIRGMEITGHDKLFGGLFLPTIASKQHC